MKLLLTIFAIVSFSLTAFSDQPNSEFDSGASEMKPNSVKAIRLKVAEEAKLACKGDRCELASVTNNGDAFVVEFNVGYGNQNGYYGNQGGVIVVGGQTQNNNYGQEPWASLKLRYITSNCTQTVNVPQSLYIAMNTYLHGLTNEDTSTKKNFAPAEQTMILFYSTILAQAKGCTDNRSGN